MGNISYAGWHDAAIYDLENTTMSYSEIARKYGRSRDTITKLKKERHIVRPSKLKRGNESPLFQDPIDQFHRNIGVHVTIMRRNSSPKLISELIGVSTHVLRKIELGLHEITLLELIRISRATNKSIPELMSPYVAESR